MSQQETEAERQLLQLKEAFMKTKGPFYFDSISSQQARSAIDFPARGPVWASRTVFPAPSNDALPEAVLQTIRNLGDGSEKLSMPTVENVKVQWSGYRPGVPRGEPEPGISEEEKYRRLLGDSKENIVIIYAHGGFFYTGSPAGSRGITAELARLTHGRCLVLDQRLSPQNPFPAPLVDALLAYLSLLYPPPGSFHEASQPQDVIFAGDSAGGNLLLSLLLLIQNMRDRHEGRVRFHEQNVDLPFPAGFVSVGCPMDLTNAFPFNELNHKFDILLPFSPTLSDEMPPCPLWPSDPPRGDIYCDTSFLCHPLVSPIAAKSFSGLPPMLLAYGEEHLGHGGRFVAQRAVKDNVAIEYHHYQRLLHDFPLMYPKLPQSQHCLREMARFCSTCVCEPQGLRVRSVAYPPEDPKLRPVATSLSNSETCGLDYQTLLERMRLKRSIRQVWTGPNRKAQL